MADRIANAWRPLSGSSRAATAKGEVASCSSKWPDGFAFRAAREAADACARLVERPVQRGLSPAALETLAIIAYVGPSQPSGDRQDPRRGLGLRRGRSGRSRPRGRGRAVGRGGRDPLPATPLFERVFGLASRSELPQLDLGGDGEEIRARLESVAERRGA